MIKENADVLGLNSVSLSISFTTYTRDATDNSISSLYYIYYRQIYVLQKQEKEWQRVISSNFRKKPKVKRKGVHSKNLSKSQRKKPS